MRRFLLITLGVAALGWGVRAIVLGSPSLRLADQSASADVSPSCLPSTVDHTAALPGTGVDVSPAPDTDSANPATQISFLGAPAAQIAQISVAGERSGR